VSAPSSNLADTQKLLRELVAEARQMQTAAGGPVTDGIAGWLASQYVSAAHEKLAGAEGSHRWEILRAFMQDWAMLRHGDHTAERLQIERERLKLAKKDSGRKWQEKIELGMNEFRKEVKNHWRAERLFKDLCDELRPQWEAQREEEFQKWVKRPEMLKDILPKLAAGLSPETRKKVEEELKLHEPPP
jgi:hypothetical protein